jgi:fumarate reductase subunit C
MINLLNAILCAVIAYFTFRSYKTNMKWALYFAVAFAIIAISHILALFSNANGWLAFIEFLRTIGYVAIAYSLITAATAPSKKK